MSEIIIYQFGKVGSTSIEHLLTEHDTSFTSTHHGAGCRSVIDSNRSKGIATRIVTGVREPISRNISAFFQNIARRGHYWYFGGRDSVLNTSIDEIIAHFNSLHTNEIVNNIFPWFAKDSEKYFYNSTGVSIYNYPFDRERGYTIIKENGISIFLYKLEKLHEIRESLTTFLGLPSDIDFLKANIATDKWYNDVYKKFLDIYTPPKKIIDLVYTSDFIKYFYTESEINAFIDGFSK